MNIGRKKAVTTTVVLFWALVAAYAGQADATVIGRFQFTAGDVKVIDPAGKSRAAIKGGELNEGDKVLAAKQASAQLKMVDDALIAIRPDTELKFDTYRFIGKEDGSERAFVSLLKGGFRTITGLIGRLNKPNYVVSTPTATIGIRGTDHEPLFIPVPPPGVTPPGPPGAYDKVNVGVAFIQTQVASVDIHPNQVGYAPAPNVAPQLLPRIPEFFKPTPPPQAKVEKREEEKKEAAPAAKPAEAGKPAEAVKAEEAPKPAPTTVEEPVRVTAVVDPTTAVTTTTTTTVTATTQATTAPSIQQSVPQIATSSTGTTVNFTNPPLSSLQSQVGDTFTHLVLAINPVAVGVNEVIDAFSPSPQPGTNYSVDASGNLGAIAHSVYESGPFGGTPTKSTSDAGIKFAGGTAADLFTTSDGSRLGRWSGGSIAVTDLSPTSPIAPFSVSLGPTSAHYLLGLEPPSGLVQLFTGTTGFNPVAHTSPTDAAGNAGTLNSAFLTANFTNQTVDAGVNLTIASKTLGAGATGMPILGNLFETPKPSSSVTCTGAGCASAYSAEFMGAFVGRAATAAGLGYDITGPADFIQGVVAFQAAAQPDTQATSAAAAASSAAALANAAATAATAVGNTTLANQATTAANNATAAASNVLAAVPPVFSATTASASTTAVSNLSSAITSTLSTASQTTAMALNVFTQIGNIATIAQQLANQASAAATAAGSSLTSVNSSVSSASTSASSAAALTPANATLAASNASTSQGLATTAASLVSTASAVFTANGAFADALIAPPAKSAMDSANSTLQATNTSVQTNATAVPTQNTNLAAAQSAASTAATQASSQLSVAQSAATAAQNAAAAAQAAAAQAATLQAANNLTGAAQQLTIVQQQLAIAQTNAANAAAAQTAASTAATTAASQLTAAQTAQTAANTALGATSSGLTTVQTNAPIVSQNSVLAQFNNPAVAATGFGHDVLAMKTRGTGVDIVEPHGGLFNKLNTSYVLDGAKNLVEIRHGKYTEQLSGTQIADADVKFSGGAAKDTFKAVDNTLYFGRWQGGSIAVTDQAATSPVPPFSVALPTGTNGPTSLHWILGLAPTPGFVQTLIGSTSYTLAGATHPTDNFGNIGVLSSGTLSADFSKQTVNTNLTVAFSTTPTDPAAVSARNLTLSASGTDAPIVGSTFAWATSSASPGFATQSGQLSVTCTGANCAPATPGYFGAIGGAFTGNGNAAPNAGVSYTFFTPPSGTPSAFSELIEGAAAFGASTTPTVGVNPTLVCPTCGLRSEVIFPISGTSPGLVFIADQRLTGTATAQKTNYVFDSLGNLVRVLSAPWNAFNLGTGAQCSPGAPCLTSPGGVVTLPVPDTAAAMLSMAGTVGNGGTTFSSATVISGTSATETFSDSNGIRFGRYQGGTVAVQDPTNGNTLITNLGSRSVNWVTREVPASIPISGSFDYTPTFATKPTDSYGSTNGTLKMAQLTANFTAQTVNAAVGVSINNQNLEGAASNVPINPSTFGFNVSSANNSTNNPSFPNAILAVTCSGSNCALPPSTGGPAYGGRIKGGFDGSAANGALFRYTFNTRYDPTNPSDVSIAGTRAINDYIDGLVAFNKAGAVSQPPVIPGSQVGSVYFSFSGPFIPLPGSPPTTPATLGSSDFPTGHPYDTLSTPANLIRDASGNLLSVTDDPNTNVPVTNEAISGGTIPTNTATPNFTSGAAFTSPVTGISYGRYAGQGANGVGAAATVSGTHETGTLATPTASFSDPVLGSYHWIIGPSAPLFLSDALRGTATYSLDGGTLPTDQNNKAGTVNSASLTVDFTKQFISNFNLQVTMPPDTAAGGTLNRVWVASSTDIALRGEGEAHFQASTGSSNPHEALTVTLNGASSGPGFVAGRLTGQNFSGAGLVYAFAGNDPLNLLNPLDPTSGSHEHVNGVLSLALSSFTNPSNVTTTGTSAINPALMPYVLGIAVTGLQPSGQFEDEGNYRVRIAANSPGRVTYDSNGIPVVFDAQRNVVVLCSTTPCGADRVPATYFVNTNGGTAMVQPDSGRDLVTGISWGRYAGGAIAVIDRITGLSLNPRDVTSQSFHLITASVQSGPTVLPTSGTANYTLVGNTNPTDNHGNVGTLGSASLSADFLNQKVSAAVSATVLGSTWAASANNMPILGGTGFTATKTTIGTTTPAPLTVTVNGSAGVPGTSTGTAGQITGAFTGTTGQGAMMGYSLNQGGFTGTTVSGVAAFRR